uniref:probable inactive histone-lysine N-methyltransferase SUVR2 isoform X2 n=1 Tax=Erigeron canadensis TaxID=72917 RepID=UPI001CB90EFB|nr:probable inactive histone-lysine N-methyltransferase SUVR2 isoform X2 [Erigeron canadensis]
MAPNPKVAKAFRAMRELGIPEEKTKPVLKNLLKIYEKNWELIEEENYRALADAIFDSQEAEEVEQKKKHDSVGAQAAEQKKKLEQAELLKVIEEETQIPEEPERPLKRLRLRHQEGPSGTGSSSNSHVTPLKKPKIEIDTLPYAIPRSQARAMAITSEPTSAQIEGTNKGKQPVSANTLVGDAEKSQPDVTNESGSGASLRPRHRRDKGKEPISPQSDRRERRSGSDRPSQGVRIKEPKPKQTAIPLIKPKDEPVSETTPLEVPPSVIRPESLTNGDSSNEIDLPREADKPQSADNENSSNKVRGNELAVIPEESTERLDIASSSSGEITITLTCNSTAKANLSVDALLTKMEVKCLNSYKFLEPSFSIKKLMNDMCECLLETETNSTPPTDSMGTCAANTDANTNGHANADTNGTVEANANGSVGNQGDSENDQHIAENGSQHTKPQSLVAASNDHSTSNDLKSLLDTNDIAKGQESVIISLVNEVNKERPPAFHYIPQNAVFQSAYVNFSLARIGDDNCCTGCFGDCLTSTTCACALQSGGEFAYTKEGLVREELLDECIKMNRDPQKHCLFYCKECPLERSKNEEIVEPCKGHSVRSFIKECWLKCGCNKQCGNRVVQRGIKRQLQVFMTPGGKGWGLRTLEDLPKGAFVCEYVGEVLTNAELYDRVSKSSNKDEHAYPVLLDADWGAESELKDDEALCLDATYYGNVARFINHRCFDSTLVEIPVEVENPDHHYYHLAFFTTRKVKALEELTWDYGIDFDDEEHPVKAFRCRCGSRFCRNVKRPNRTRKRRYN